MYLNDYEDDYKTMFEDFYAAQYDVLRLKNDASKKKLYDAAVKFNLNS